MNIGMSPLHRMPASLRSVVALVCAASVLLAAPPTASVSSAGAIKLNGVDVPASAARSTPLNLGDRLCTDASPAVLRLDAYGATITVDGQSCALTGVLNDKPFVRLQSGALSYKLTSNSPLVIYKGEAVVKTQLSGIVRFGSHTKSALILAGAGGGAAAATVALAKRSKECPSGQSKDKDCGNK